MNPESTKSRERATIQKSTKLGERAITLESTSVTERACMAREYHWVRASQPT